MHIYIYANGNNSNSNINTNNSHDMNSNMSIYIYIARERCTGREMIAVGTSCYYLRYCVCVCRVALFAYVFVCLL